MLFFARACKTKSKPKDLSNIIFILCENTQYKIYNAQDLCAVDQISRTLRISCLKYFLLGLRGDLA